MAKLQHFYFLPFFGGSFQTLEKVVFVKPTFEKNKIFNVVLFILYNHSLMKKRHDGAHEKTFLYFHILAHH